jgi:cytochrome c-type biogenesis protein
MAGELPFAFLAGVLSVVTPCVLPLVPTYLSMITGVEASRLGESGTARRVVLGSVPFFVGFTAVFVALGAFAAAVVEVVDKQSQTRIAGFVLVVFGLAFAGLLPLPKRIVGGGLLVRARDRGSGALLGGAFAICAAPCIGPVLGSVLVLAGEDGSVLEACVVLAAYSLGIAASFVAVGVAFARTMGTFRWLRDRWQVVQVASGAVLVAVGLLLFFDRDGWLQAQLNRLLNVFGAGV